MAASPADQACAWGVIRVNNPSDVRAYDEEKTCFSFVPDQQSPMRYAIDVELKSRTVPDVIGGRLGLDGLALWTEIEVLAKLTDTPAHLVFRRCTGGDVTKLQQECGVEILRCDTPTHFIAVGRKAMAAD